MSSAFRELEDSLGRFGYRWLIACANFPCLRLPITLHIGAALKRADGEPPPDEKEVLALAALPWFRQGWMPDNLRGALLTQQTSQDRATVREALIDLLHVMVSASTADARGSVTVARVTSAPKDFLDDWMSWREGLPPTLLQRDMMLDRLLDPARSRRRAIRVLVMGVALSAIGLAAGILGMWYFGTATKPALPLVVATPKPLSTPKTEFSPASSGEPPASTLRRN